MKQNTNITKIFAGISLSFAILLGSIIPVLTGCGRDGADTDETRQDKPAIVIGGKNFTEQYILAALAGELLQQAGFEVVLRTGVGSDIARQSLLQNQIDLYFEYTGTAYTVFHEQSDSEIMSDPDRVYEWVKQKDAENNLVWLERIDFNNTFTLIMREDQAQQLGIASISDLANYVTDNPSELIFAIGVEFYERPDGFQKLVETYGFQPPSGQVRQMSIGLTYTALQNEQVDVSMGFETDGRIDAFGFVALEDDKQFFPVYNPAAVVRKQILEQHPEVREALAPLTDELNTDAMRMLNRKVDVEYLEPEEVAADWLREKGLL